MQLGGCRVDEQTGALAQLEQLIVTGRVRQAIEARNKANEREDAQNELQQFKPHYEKFVAASMIADDAALALEERDRQKLALHAQKIRALASAIREAATDEAVLLKFGRLLTDARTDILGAISILEQGFVKSVRERFDPLESLGKVVGGFPSLRQLGAEIEKLSSESGRLTEKFPPTSPQLTRLADLKKRRTDAMERLSASDAGAELANFLLKVASQQATLADVTPAVRKWLDEQRASKLFQVRFGA